MQVGEILKMINKFTPILEHYRDCTVDEMLNDIYQKCCIPFEQDGLAARDAKPVVDQVPAQSGKLSPAEAVLVLSGMDREEQLSWLTENKYIVAELKQIAACLKLKVGKANKDEIKNIIVNRGKSLDMLTTAEPKKAEPNIRANKLAGTKQQKQNKKKQEEPNVSKRVTAALEQITVMQQEEISAYLAPFHKYEVLEIARSLNLRIAASNRKENIILLIAKHIGYPELNRRIANRPSSLLGRDY